MKRVYGLTGNMGCGKSTVLYFFKQFREVETVMTDQIAKEVMEEPEILSQIAKIFGSPVISHWQIDYEALRDAVYADEKLFRALEEIVHPPVWQKVEEIVAKSTKEIIIVESAIIFETTSEKRFDAIILTACQSKLQKARLEERGHTALEITRITDRQFSLEYKEKYSDYIIRTDGTIKETKARVRKLYQEIMEEEYEY